MSIYQANIEGYILVLNSYNMIRDVWLHGEMIHIFLNRKL